MNQKQSKQQLFQLFKKGLLPIEKNCEIYSVFADYYDFSMNYIEYDYWIEYLNMIMNMNQFKPKKILDLAVGTGNILILLAKLGYEVEGCDFSEPMIFKTKEKLKQYKLNSNVYFADMRRLKCPQKYNLIVCLNDSFNYMKSLDELKSAFKGVYEYLEDDGALFFDVSSESNIFTNFNEPLYEKTLKGAYSWYNAYDTITKILDSNLDFLDYETGKVFRESHQQRIHTIDEIKITLQKSGFNEIDVFGGFTLLNPLSSHEVYHFWVRK